MTTNKPYRLLSDPMVFESINIAFASKGLTVSSCTDPDNAYEPAILELRSEARPSIEIVVQFDRAWWPNGHDFEDSRVSLKLDGRLVHEIDVSKLLFMKLSVPLTDHIISELVAASQNAT